MRYGDGMLFKVLGEKQQSYHGGRGTWTRGVRRVARGPLKPCRNGIHLCRADDLVHWLGPQIWVAEPYGARIDGPDKIVVRGATIRTRVRTWNETTARLFAADVAEVAVQRANITHPAILGAIQAARDFARGRIGLNALRAACTSAAHAAADAAYVHAAAYAAYAAARSAAYAARYAAAPPAAAYAAAAADAAHAVAYAEQTCILFKYLNGERA
jgi:hypothetical protein